VDASASGESPGGQVGQQTTTSVTGTSMPTNSVGSLERARRLRHWLLSGQRAGEAEYPDDRGTGPVTSPIPSAVLYQVCIVRVNTRATTSKTPSGGEIAVEEMRVGSLNIYEWVNATHGVRSSSASRR